MAGHAASAFDFSWSTVDDSCAALETGVANHEYVEMESSQDSDTYSESVASNSSFYSSSISQSTGATSATDAASNVCDALPAIHPSILAMQTQRSNALDYCIDPRLTSIGPTPPNNQPISDRRNWCYEAQAFSDDATLQEIGDALPILHSSGLSQHCQTNDFDIAFHEDPVKSQDPIPDSQMWLRTWVATNPDKMPNERELASLKTLSGLPETEIIAWLSQRICLVPISDSEAEVAKTQGGPHRTHTKRYRPKCRRSKHRFRHVAETRDATRVLECTHGCGKSFDVKGPWTRHELSNIEEWKCHECKFISPRKDKLRKHLQQHHGFRGALKQSRRHQLLQPEARPCGFCLKSFNNWSEWLNHVAAHFQGRIAGGPWTMARWNKAVDQNCDTDDSADDDDDDDDSHDDRDENDEDEDSYDNAAQEPGRSTSKGKGASYGSGSENSTSSSGSSISGSAGSHYHKLHGSTVEIPKTDTSSLPSDTSQLLGPAAECHMDTLTAHADDSSTISTRRRCQKLPALARPHFRGEAYHAPDSVRRPSSARVGQQAGQTLDVIQNVRNRAKTEALTQGQLKEEKSEKQELGPRDLQRHDPGKFWKVGKVFSMFWHENAGEGQKSKRTSLGRSEMKYKTYAESGQDVPSNIRRLVMVKEYHGVCICLPIKTYGRAGLAKRVLNSQDRNAHSVIYMSEATPSIGARQNIHRRKEPMAFGDHGSAQAMQHDGSSLFDKSDAGEAQELMTFSRCQEDYMALSDLWDTGIPSRIGGCTWTLQRPGPSGNENRTSTTCGADEVGESPNVQRHLGSRTSLKLLASEFLVIPKAAYANCQALINRHPAIISDSSTYIDVLGNRCKERELESRPHVCHDVFPASYEWAGNDIGGKQTDHVNNVSNFVDPRGFNRKDNAVESRLSVRHGVSPVNCECGCKDCAVKQAGLVKHVSNFDSRERTSSGAGTGTPLTQPTNLASSSLMGHPPTFDTIRRFCRPGGQGSSNYMRFKIERFLNEPEPSDEHDYPADTYPTGSVMENSRSIFGRDPEDDLGDNDGREGSWLKTDAPSFRNWLDSRSSCFWLSGSPGAGKTILASSMIDDFPRRPAPEDLILPYFYCDASDDSRGGFGGGDPKHDLGHHDAIEGFRQKDDAPLFRDWLDSLLSCFWLSGSPDVGKTTSTFSIDDFLMKVTLKDSILTYLYYNTRDGSSSGFGRGDPEHELGRHDAMEGPWNEEDAPSSPDGDSDKAKALLLVSWDILRLMQDWRRRRMYRGEGRSSRTPGLFTAAIVPTALLGTTGYI